MPERLFNSIINKTPIDAKTNRIIGGNSPSRYLPKLREENAELRQVLEAHWLDQELLESDQFAECFVQRGEAMLDLIGEAMGKRIAGGQETFWTALSFAGVAEPPEAIPQADVNPDAYDSDDETEFNKLGEAANELMAADN